jgi:copper(I)-binding protein
MKTKLFAFALALLGGLAQAHEFKAGDIRVVHPYAVPSLAGVANGQGFVDFTNRGTAADSLVGVSSPVAKRVEIHEMKMDGNIMRMREVSSLPIAPGQTVRMADSGIHLMLIELKAPLKVGDKLPLTLKFARSGDLRIEMWVQDKALGDKAMHDHHQK